MKDVIAFDESAFISEAGWHRDYSKVLSSLAYRIVLFARDVVVL